MIHEILPFFSEYLRSKDIQPYVFQGEFYIYNGRCCGDIFNGTVRILPVINTDYLYVPDKYLEAHVVGYGPKNRSPVVGSFYWLKEDGVWVQHRAHYRGVQAFKNSG